MTHFGEGTSDSDKRKNYIKHLNYKKADKYYCVYKVFNKIIINIVVTYDDYEDKVSNSLYPYIYAEYNEVLMYANGHIIYEDDIALVLPKTPQNHAIIQEQFGEYLI